MNKHIFEWYNKEIKTKILEEIPEINLLTISIGPYKKGDEPKLPFWLAKVLVMEKLAEYSEDINYDIEELLKIQRICTEKSTLADLDKDFYIKISETIKNLRDEISNNTDFSKKSQILQKIDKLHTIFKEIYHRRQYKILKLASMENFNTSRLRNMTEEELILFYKLQEIINKWENEFIKI